MINYAGGFFFGKVPTSEEDHGRHCLVTWDKVCMPLEYGGLGIQNLTLEFWIEAMLALASEN